MRQPTDHSISSLLDKLNDDQEREDALRILCELTDDEDTKKQAQTEIIAKNGIQIIAALLQTNEEAEYQGDVAFLIAKLATNRQAQQTIRENGAIPPLVNLLKSEDYLTAQFAALAIGNLAEGNLKNKNAACEANAIPGLVELISPTDPAADSAAWAIMNLAISSPENKTAILNTAVVSRLLSLSNSTEASDIARVDADAALHELRSEPKRTKISRDSSTLSSSSSSTHEATSSNWDPRFSSSSSFSAVTPRNHAPAGGENGQNSTIPTRSL